MIKSVAVCSRSFSSNKFLVNKLKKKFKKVRLNKNGQSLSGEKLINFLTGYESAIIGLEEISENIVNKLPTMKVISKYGVGIDKIDLNALKKNKIKFRYTPGVNKRSVSELVLGKVLNLLRNTCKLNGEVMAGKWKQNRGSELSSLKFGIVGFGHIGRDLARLLKPFNCEILFYDTNINIKESKIHKIKRASLNKLFKTSDVISIHLPLTVDTKNLISRSLLNTMKSNSILINTARGGIVNENDLYHCLKNNKIRSAAFDVLNNEPPLKNKLIGLENFFITPHIGSSTTQSVNKMGLAAIEGLLKN